MLLLWATMNLYSPAAKQVIASNQRTDGFTSLPTSTPATRLPRHGPTPWSHPFLPKIMISANNYRGIPPRFREAAIIAIGHDGDRYARGDGAGPAGTAAAGPMLEANLMNLIKGRLQKFWLSNNFSVKFTRSCASAASPDQSWYASDATVRTVKVAKSATMPREENFQKNFGP